MFNNVKVYEKVIIDKNFHYSCDYILQIDDSFYPTSDNKNPDDYDLVLSTSSLDNLETFILRLYAKKNKSKNEIKLLNFLYLFWKSYTGELSNSLWDYFKEVYTI